MDVLGPAEQLLWMQRLLRHAEVVGRQGEIPVAAVMVDSQGRAVGWGSNRRERDQQPLGHAELVALQQAARLRGDWRFNDCTLLVTMEPCPMCAGALVNARIGRLVYGCHDEKAGAISSLFVLGRDPRLNHRFPVVAGVLGDECAALLRSFFVARRRPR